jgi:hypothetical protein
VSIVNLGARRKGGRPDSARPSQEITALRKGGRLDDAFRLALDLIAAPEADEWVWSAYGWCLIDLVKRHASDREPGPLQEYIGQLSAFQVPGGNHLLAEHRERALALADEDRRAVMEARKLGKNGQHEQAVRAYATLQTQGKLRDEDKAPFGWELFHAIKSVLKAAGGKDLAQSAVGTIKQHLNSYIKLGLSGPSLLHSCMLQYALRLSHADHLRLVAFARLWKLENFRPEDYEGSTADDGKVFEPLAELVLQRASKEAAEGKRPDEMQFILPYVERALERFPDNVWLKLNMVKLLRGLDRLDEARQLATEFARKKAGEYWAWEILGDLETDRAMRLSCYAKALSCSEDDKFVSKVRLKFARILSDDHPGQAKAEVERVIEHKRREVTRIPPEADQLTQSDWFQQAVSAPAGRSFYDRFKSQAEELLFRHLPWTDASLGDQFVIEGKDGQKNRSRRRIYVRASPAPLEISVSASHPDVKGQASGVPIRLQMETSPEEPWRSTVHRIQPREDGRPYDIFPEMYGVIDHVNHGKALLHFVVAKGVDGTCPLGEFPGVAEPGVAISVRMARHHSRNGLRSRVISIAPTTGTPGKDICRAFNEAVEVRNGLGFTSEGIFIPPDLVASAGISDGDLVEGVAVISYNKKRSTWGWKAMKAVSLVGSDDDPRWEENDLGTNLAGNLRQPTPA